MARDDDFRDRDKKTFAELDKMRREKAHSGSGGRRDEHGGGGGSGDRKRLEGSNAYKAYKGQLDKIFSGGGLPDALKEKLADAGVGKQAKERKAAHAKIRAATTPAETLAALNEFRAAHGFPDDEGVLARLLDLESEPTVVAEALRTLIRLQSEGALEKANAVKRRVEAAAMTAEDDDVVSLAKELLARL